MQLKDFIHTYARWIPTVALFGGFVIDIFTFSRPDTILANSILFAHIVLTAVVIVLLQTRKILENEQRRVLLLAALQFSFGNLSSAMMILYAHSGTLAGSAIFVILLGSLFLGNELLKDRYARNTLRMGIWFFLLLSYCTLVLPMLTHRIGTLIFFGSVAIALTLALLYIKLCARLLRMTFSSYFQHVRFVIIAIAVVFVLLYMANFIPPVPLSTKHMGVYHDVVKIGSDYIVELEPRKWYMFWRDSDTTIHVRSGMPLYCFSSIFAPGNLQADIYHSWERFDPQRKTWESVARIPFSISGGRLDGYRGYTYLVHLTDGKWRCRAETRKGAAMGQTAFTVKLSDTKPYTERTKY